jgi:TDG/mug DNA glycosylase family protein
MQTAQGTTAWRPSATQIQDALGKRLPDVIARELVVLFVGINPSLYSAAVGHHFARPGNRFWPALHGAGITPQLFSPFEDARLVEHDCGITNIVARATARADELATEELRRGARSLAAKVRRRQIDCVAFLGVTAYRAGFGRSDAKIGPQADKIGGAKLFVLPNPSGLNAHYQLPQLVELFGELRRFI